MNERHRIECREQLAAMMVDIGYNQTAQRVKLNRGLVWNIVKGKQNPTAHTYKAVFGKDPEPEADNRYHPPKDPERMANYLLARMTREEVEELIRCLS